MQAVRADIPISVTVDGPLVVAAASLRRETPTANGGIYRFIYDDHLECHLDASAGRLELLLGPPGGQQRDVARLVVETAPDGLPYGLAGIAWGRDYGPPFEGLWIVLGGELRVSVWPWRRGQRLDGAFTLRGKIEGSPAVLTGAFHSPDPSLGSCIAHSGGSFRSEEEAGCSS